MTKGHDKGHKGHKGQMSDREAMRIALDALKTADKKIIAGGIGSDARLQMKNAITTLRQALEQPEHTNIKDLIKQCVKENGHYYMGVNHD